MPPDQWCLVYGDGDGQPKLLLLATAVESHADLVGADSDSEIALMMALTTFGESAGLPVFQMRFSSADATIARVGIKANAGDDWSEISVDDFAEIAFVDNGLDISQGTNVKPINDRSSSAYHEWQRARLGGGVVVTDIDLIRLNDEGRPVEVLELFAAWTRA